MKKTDATTGIASAVAPSTKQPASDPNATHKTGVADVVNIDDIDTAIIPDEQS